MSKNYRWKNYYLSFSYFATSFRSILASEIPAKYVNKGKYLLYIIKLTCSKVPCTLISYCYFQILPWSYYQIFHLCFFCTIIRENYSLLTSHQHYFVLYHDRFHKIVYQLQFWRMLFVIVRNIQITNYKIAVIVLFLNHKTLYFFVLMITM